MSWSDCHLKMLVTFDADSCKLKFIQPPTNEVLADFNITKEQLRTSFNGDARPNLMARMLFWLTSGLRDFTPCITIESHMQPCGLARFYQCMDRKGRNRVFAEVMDQNHDGAIFILKDEDFFIIEKQVEDIKNQAEQDAALKAPD